MDRTPPTEATLVTRFGALVAAAHSLQIDGIILLAGGQPSESGRETTGGVGVGDARAGSLDEKRARTAFDHAKDNRNRHLS